MLVYEFLNQSPATFVANNGCIESGGGFRGGLNMWGGINRRKFPRANYPCVLTVKRKDQRDTLSTQTENIGLGGICVILPRDLGIFAPVEISLDLLDGQPVIECDGTVAWVIASKENRKTESFDTGLEFTNLKRKDAVRINSVVEKVIDAQ